MWKIKHSVHHNFSNIRWETSDGFNGQSGSEIFKKVFKIYTKNNNFKGLVG